MCTPKPHSCHCKQVLINQSHMIHRGSGFEDAIAESQVQQLAVKSQCYRPIAHFHQPIRSSSATLPKRHLITERIFLIPLNVSAIVHMQHTKACHVKWKLLPFSCLFPVIQRLFLTYGMISSPIVSRPFHSFIHPHPATQPINPSFLTPQVYETAPNPKNHAPRQEYSSFPAVLDPAGTEPIIGATFMFPALYPPGPCNCPESMLLKSIPSLPFSNMCRL